MTPAAAVESIQAGAASTPDGLQPHQKVVAIVIAITMLVVVVELVRKRKLREEYSLLWIGTAVVLMALAWEYRLLQVFQDLVGIVEPQFALFFGGLLFLMLIALQFSVRLSKLTYRNKALSQRVALLERELLDLQGSTGSATGEDRRPEREGQTRAPQDS